jgi:hypothetical protein
MENLIETNNLQTPITDELVNSLPKEVQDQLFDCINNIPLIKNLISPNREYAKDRPRDSKGRIIVDLANPHILEDMDYFRPSAIHFEKYGCYTFLKPNSNPNSEFSKWFREEVRRCWNGYVRPSDGEWITGYMYYYMNYSPIMLSKIEEGTNVANRVEGFPETWDGIYLRFHYLEQARRGGLYNNFRGGEHCIELARRGASKSFSLASIMSHNFILGENAEANKRTMTVLTAYQKEYLAGKDGTLNKFTPMIDFASQHTQFPRKRLKNSNQEMMWQMGYKDVDTGVDKGTLNTVIGVSSKDDESKLRGKRGYILVEEMGSFPKLLTIYNIVRHSVEEGDYTFGLIYLVGTSGDSESDFGSAKEMMYSPSGYHIYSLPNVYDKIGQGRPNFGFFFPAYLDRKGCYDNNGNSDVIKALIQILKNRYHTKYNSEDPNTITKVIAEMPITPAEAIIKVNRTLFPITDLTERLLQIENNPSEYDDVYVGELVIRNGNVEFRPTTDVPIRNFPHKDNKIAGAIEIFKMPEKDTSGKVFRDRYILGADPYDDDSSETMSLGSIFVLDLWTDKIVAEYTGRPNFADDYYEVCRRLCLFYNGKLNYENNKKGLYAHFRKMNSLHLLTDVLEFLKDKDMIKAEGLYGNKLKGTNASAPINNYAITLQRDWLLRPIKDIQIVDGESIEVDIPNLYKLRNKALIQEYISYNKDGNFDRISAMGMLMLLREDRMVLYGGDIKKTKDLSTDANYLGNDDFFSKNFKAPN